MFENKLIFNLFFKIFSKPYSVYAVEIILLTKLEKRKLKKKRKTALIVDNHMHPKIAGVKAVELVILPQKNYIKNTTHGSGII